MTDICFVWNKLLKQFWFLENLQLHLQKQIRSPEQNNEQALQPVVGNFDTLVEATSEEKAPLWWDKNTCSCGIL